VRRHKLVADAVIAVVLSALVLMLAPGLAIVGMLAILVIAICGMSLLLDAKQVRAGGRRAPRRRSSAQGTRRTGRSR
jgi:ABC-type bacteriocin/lantibiotic exporter with double-glycine peptidase domain